MSMTNTKEQAEVEVLGVQRRRRWGPSEKLEIVRETYEPGMSVSLVARKHGVNPNQLFQWRKLERAGALTAVDSGQAVVPATELDAARRQIGNCNGSSAKRRWRTRFSRRPWRSPATESG